ncbi:MAG: glycoside hydrolase family 3 N-terminal domain-containing protein [Bacteroidia bacterium]
MMRFRVSFISIFAAVLFGFSFRSPKDEKPDFLNQQSRWADSVFKALSPDERLAQLFMVASYSNKDMKHVRETRELIQKYNIGGLIMMQGGPLRQAKILNYYQDMAKTPLLISIDGEWGLAMRLDSTPRYPKQMALGAIQNDSLIYLMGRQIAKECKRMGIHVNFAPVADVNNNSANPVIGIRSFGENKYKVAQKAYMYMQGLQDEHVMANGKHFPGHGDTDSDSHKTLPQIPYTRERLDSLELYPFKYLFGKGLASIMVAHLNVPALDTTKNLASTLSPNVVNKLLKQELGFKGLVFTDALNMKGVANYYAPGIVDVKALLAGNDVLLFAEDVPKAMEEIKKAIVAGEIKQEEIDERCKKILKAKYWCGLNKKQFVHLKDLVEDLNTPASMVLNARLAEASMTLLKNDNSLLPLKSLDTLRIAEVSIGVAEKNTFSNALANYMPLKHAGIEHDATKKDVDSLFEKIKDCNLVILQINKSTLKLDNNFGVTTQSLRIIDSITKLKPTVTVFFNNPYLLNSIKNPERMKAAIMAYEYTGFSQKAAADAIAGAINVNGRLPVSTAYFRYNAGVDITTPIRIQFVEPELLNIQKKKLAQVDSIARYGIAEKAYPGCQVVAIKDGKVFYQRSFGNYTYDANSSPVTNSTVYDLASVTKIAASCLSLMTLSSEGKFDYKQTLCSYLPELKNCNKEDMVIEEMLSHQAGLQAWIPFWMRTVDKQGNYKPGIYSDTYSKIYSVQVAKGLFVKKEFADSIYSRIISSKIENKGKYLYSDLGYYFVQRIIEKLTQQRLNEYVRKFYARLGGGLTYLPLQKYDISSIAPTENDTKFRKQVVQGYVHDPGAALLGGVAGHAGLFGTATDLATLMQMYLNKGYYGGERYLDSNVVKDYTRCHFCPGNRRGLCFEKPEPDPKKDSPVTDAASLESYGHSGFTGTFAWADPKNNLIMVFTSNRVYPDAEPNKLAKLGIRGKIHKVLYEAVQ